MAIVSIDVQFYCTVISTLLEMYNVKAVWKEEKYLALHSYSYFLSSTSPIVFKSQYIDTQLTFLYCLKIGDTHAISHSPKKHFQMATQTSCATQTMVVYITEQMNINITKTLCPNKGVNHIRNNKKPIK